MSAYDTNDHDHDADDAPSDHDLLLAIWALLLANSRELRLISKQLHQLKEVVMSDQSTQAHLDSDVSKLRDEIKAELDAVKAANPSVDLSGLDKLVTDNTPAPAASAPVSQPDTAGTPAPNPAATPPAPGTSPAA